LLGAGIRNHLPLLRVLALLISIWLLIGWGLTATGREDSASELPPRDWQWAPASSFGDTVPPSDGWLPYSADLSERGGVYWLRIPLPADDVREPALLLGNAVAVSVFDGDRRLYAYDPALRRERLNLIYHWNLAPLPVPLPSEALLLLDNRGSPRPELSARLVAKGDLLAFLIRKDAYAFVLSALFLFGSFVAMSLYFIRKDRLHLYFALTALCGSYASLVRNSLLQWLWDMPWLSFVELAVFPLGVYGFLSILIEVFDPGHTRILRRIRWIILGFALCSLTGAFVLSPKAFAWLLSYPLLTMFLVTAAFIFHSIRKAYRSRQGPESVWMLGGFLVVTTVALIHVLRTYLPSLFDRFQRTLPILRDWPYDLLSIALFLFLICLVRIIMYRFGHLNDRLQSFNRSLEARVLVRTAELLDKEEQLREANGRLAVTMRDTAEAIASSMVLEERHRLTGAIHDSIGHSLTATLMQLEAAKRLLPLKPDVALSKLDASRELVRRGMEEIRSSASMLREDSSRYDLQSAMENLIEETQKSTGATIARRISELPIELTALRKRVLFQALQEGLTNGLRHGGSRRFRFELRRDREILRFRLESDGRTYTPSAFGFGLKAMSERVSSLGGTLVVAPGNPGCVLTLTLPYTEADLRSPRGGEER